MRVFSLVPSKLEKPSRFAFLALDFPSQHHRDLAHGLDECGEHSLG